MPDEPSAASTSGSGAPQRRPSSANATAAAEEARLIGALRADAEVNPSPYLNPDAHVAEADARACLLKAAWPSALASDLTIPSSASSLT